MIESMKIKFGASIGSGQLEVPNVPITIFVGPNNSGKSLVLKELSTFCKTGKLTSTKILENIEIESFSEERKSEILEICTQEQRKEKILNRTNLKDYPSVDELKRIIQAPMDNPAKFARFVLEQESLLLNSVNRMKHIDTFKVNDLNRPSSNSLVVLFRDDKKREKLRTILFDAFSKYFVIDPTRNFGSFSTSFSNVEPKNSTLEQGLHDEAVTFHANAVPIHEMSDGVKAFTGIMMEIIAGNPSILMMDEPEAFLHPTLAFKLGLEVAKSLSETRKNMFVSTHSANFIMGCIQSGVDINIIRLTYDGEVGTARYIPSLQLLEMMKDPLLRSIGVINGLFYDSVIVTEADSDRAFYQEVNERMNLTDGSGIQNCLFLNGHGKDTVQTIVEPLRGIGIPTVPIVDIDIIKNGGGKWSSFLKAGFIPQASREGLARTRESIYSQFKMEDVDMKKDGGIYALANDGTEASENMLNQLAEYGLFVVKGGEVESWLKDLDCFGHGPKWLVPMFEKLGADPSDPNYIRPTDDDVWQFLTEIKKWMENKSRKGIPV